MTTYLVDPADTRIILATHADQGRWYEVAPAYPEPAGDLEEFQITEAYGRRWALATGDGRWAVQTVAFYVAERGDHPPTLTQYAELLICTNIDDPGSTEEWSDTEYRNVETSHAPSEADARNATAGLPVPPIQWTGEPFADWSWTGED